MKFQNNYNKCLLSQKHFCIYLTDNNNSQNNKLDKY